MQPEMPVAEEFIPTLTHAAERDIDLLLVEELYASPLFVSWMCGKAGLPTVVEASTVLHSKRRTRNRREIDIFVDMTLPKRTKAALLIENKLDATEQPDQAESYREELFALADRYADRAMLIVCPEQYQAAHREFAGKFDAVVTYEELARYFSGKSTSGGIEGGRMRFRAELLEQAINKGRRGYVAVPNEEIGDFNAAYVALLAEIAPEILPGPSMLKAANPDESVSMIFDHTRSFANLPREIRPTRFAHEFGRGQSHRANYVSAVFGGWGAALPAVNERFEQDARELGASFTAKPPTKVRPNPGLVMICSTPAINNQGDYGQQRQAIVAGIQRAEILRGWLLNNGPLLQSWKRQVKEAITRS
ncbi:PD-(D/E)XK nuclease family protein [Sphingomonas faeni]|uniref:PD-(D/E)XK nuclease family protein n=1 Tax=Sphingomonas faeni TaxID=185950 RepID=UPI0020C071E0|nr:PD-(D/E)XK nuclease family protein [Sphingomonas faeni]MCK8458660.1 PD-(D/E)XK nuclease family protein [Sphingomonas faeni]